VSLSGEAVLADSGRVGEIT